jgi:hypothetical protein
MFSVCLEDDMKLNLDQTRLTEKKFFFLSPPMPPPPPPIQKIPSILPLLQLFYQPVFSEFYYSLKYANTENLL